MHRISADNPVRRRLFPDDDEESRVDNFINNFQESIARDKMEKMLKWNFDFENEVALDGIYKWYRVEDCNDWTEIETKYWIGVKTDEMDTSEKLKDDLIPLSVKLENEATPKVMVDKRETSNPERKRKQSISINTVETVRKKLDFKAIA